MTVQELVDLTPEQKKAWTALVRAVNRCKKENILFYQVLEKLYGLNGKYVDVIVDDSNERLYELRDDCNLQDLCLPFVKTECSFADDTHFVILKEKALKKLEEK